ncbi:DUF4123 domain-containing protein [Providencia stuartii]
MPSSYSDIYQGYWVAECRYTRNNETFTGIMTLAGHSEEQVIGNMRHYFAENQAEYSFAQYDTLTPLITYVENSQQLELLLLRQIRRQHAESRLAVLVDERNLTNPLPSEKGDIHYQVGQPALLDDVDLYMVIDSGEYHRQTGQYLVPMLHGSQLPWQSLYQGETQDSLAEQAPYLVHIQRTVAGRHFLAQCLNLPNKATVGLFFNSFKSFADVHRQMRKMTYLYNRTLNSWNFFRFYDVSHFIPFIESLTRGQLFNVVSGVTAFYGYSTKYPGGVEITFHKDYLHDTYHREALLINERLYRHYAQLTLMSTLDKAQQAIRHQDNSIPHDKVAKKALDNFCLHAANQAFLTDTTQMQALIYNLLARYLSRHDVSLWQRACEHALPYQHNQVLFNHHCYIYCLNAQGETA